MALTFYCWRNVYGSGAVLRYSAIHTVCVLLSSSRSDPRSRTCGLGPTVSDSFLVTTSLCQDWVIRSRTRGPPWLLLRGGGAMLHPTSIKEFFGTSPEGIPRGASSMILCLLEIGLHTRTCCLGLATKESQCVTFLGTATGRGLPPGPNPEPKHTILCLWSRTRSPCWRNLCSAICLMVAELCSATLSW